MKTKKRFLSLLLCGAMLFSLCSQPGFAEGAADSGQTVEAGGLCEHHPEHDADCGYTEGTPETPCGHEHTEDCYALVTVCVHEHTAECYPEEAEEGISEGGAEEREPENCSHVCGEESGCITKKLDCKHEHDGTCGYVPAIEGAPCTFVCEECKQAGENTPEEPETDCICTALCTTEAVNEDCPVCGAEDADLALCKGERPAAPSNAEAVTVAIVQAMIDDLPNADEITDENAEAVKALLEAIDEARAELSDEQQELLDFAKYVSAAEALGSIYAVSPLADDEVRYSTDGGNTWVADSLMDAIWASYGEQNIIIELLQNITLDSSWYPQDLGYGGATVVLDGKGFSITRSSGVGVFVVRYGSNVTLRDITIDGGAIWSSDDPATRTNSGVVGKGATNHLIYVAGNATLTLDSGVNLQNTDMADTAYGAAVVVGYSGEGTGHLIMKAGATIRNNTADSGGAVCVWSTADVFEMQGGTIFGNYAASGGGAVLINGGSFIMGEGEISNNASGNNGGGVTVKGSFIMNGGSITGNKSVAGGGGVTILSGGVDLTGGRITDNTITGTLGGGLLVNGGSLTVSGNPVVTGNTDKNTDSNIYLPSGRTIAVPGSLDDGASMGVTTAVKPSEGNPVNVTGSNNADYSSRFFSDAGYSVVNNDDNYVQLAMLPCEVTFDANGGTGQMAAQSFTSGVAQELSSNTFTRDGYVFDGWNTQGDGSGTSYRDGQSIVVSKDITLYAQWKHVHTWGEWTSNGDGTHTRTCKSDSSHTETEDCVFDADGTCTVCGYSRVTITAQPGSITVTEGQTASFRVAATGGNLTYQWQISTDKGSTWTDISGANADNYTTAATTTDMNGYQYRCVVKGDGGEATSDAATLTVKHKVYTVTVETEGQGTASASPSSAAAGTEITLTAAAKRGYRFKGWQVVSGNVTITGGRFVMPAENVTVKAIFERTANGGTSGWGQQTGSPKTGDSSHMGLWLFSLCASAGALAGLLIFRRREEEENSR